MNNSSLDCANWTAQNRETYEWFTYWFGGLAVTIIAVTGMLLNLAGACLILTRLSKHNIFNHMIVLLFIVDTFFLFFIMLSVMTQNLRFNNRMLTIMFPKVSHPLSSVFLTLSVFLTVGVTHERFVAIKYLLIHNQQITSAKFRRTKLLKYILPMVFSAIAFNIPKFFEAELDWSANDQR